MTAQYVDRVGPKWDEVAWIFEWDGALLDLVVRDTTADDWEAALRAIRDSPFEREYRRAGVVEPIPSRREDATHAEDRAPSLLVVRVGGLQIHCHFFCDEEIELDVDPRELAGQRELDALVQLMTLLARATRKGCVLTGESAHAHALLAVDACGAVRTRAPSEAP